MAKVLSKTGVQTGQTIQAFHISQSVDAFTGQAAYNITISGGLTVNGYAFPTADGIADQVMATDGSGNLTFQTLPLAATASFITSSGVKGPYGGDSITTASYAVSASHVEFADLASASYHAVNASDANTATSASYARTASVVTDPNVAFLDQNNTFTGTNQTFTNIIVNGTGSFAYFQSVTGSAKIIGDAFIILNNDTPSERYAGVKVYDSGSANTTASLEFDGLTNDWFYEYSDDGGATTDHGVVLFGPEYATKGSPTYPTSNRIVKGNGDHHIVDSSITDNGTTVSTSLPFTATQITASSGFKGNLVGNVTGTATTASYVDWPNIDNKPALLSSSAQIASDISGAFTEASASFSTRVTALEDFSSSLDTNYVTEAELVAATASLSASLAADISTNKTDIDTLENKTLVSGSSQITLQSTAGDLSGSRIDGAVQTSTSASYALTASHALNAASSTTDTGSLLTTASAAGTTITFTKGDGSTFDVEISQTGSVQSASFATSASHAEFSDNSRDSVSSSFAITASYALNVDPTDTSSLLTTASAAQNVITFTKGDSSTFEITIATGSAESASFATSASHAEFADNSRDAVSSSHADSTITSSHALSGNGNFDGNFSGSLVATGDILPSITETFDIGSPTKRFRELYLTGSSIFLGDKKLTIENNFLKVVDSASGEQAASDFSGSFTGSFLGTFDGSIESSSFASTASYISAGDVDGTVANATTSSYSISSSHAEFSDNSRDSVSSSFALTASFALNAGSGGSVDTGSLLVTASATTNVITFTKGDSSTFAVTVDTGSGGGGVTETLEYNGQVRYEIVSGSTKAQLVSTGNVYKNLSWSRSSTTLTVTSTAHGLSTGDNVLIRNMSEDYELKSITTSGSDAFTCTVADSGDTSGTTGAYIPAFDCSTISLTSGVVTVTAPGAGDLQLNSMMVYAPSSESDPITVNIPAGDSNSGGINSALDTRFPPLCTFYKLDGPNPVLSSTTVITYSKTANFAQYSIGGGSPDTFGAVQFVLRF